MLKDFLRYIGLIRPANSINTHQVKINEAVNKIEGVVGDEFKSLATHVQSASKRITDLLNTGALTPVRAAAAQKAVAALNDLSTTLKDHA